VAPGGDEPVFERVEGAITIGPALGLDERRRQFYDFVAEGTRPEQPFLAELRQRNAHELRAVFAFFEDSSVQLPTHEVAELSLDRTYARFPRVRDLHAGLLNAAGTGVVDVRLHTTNPDLKKRLEVGLTAAEADQEIGADDDVVSLFVHQGPIGDVGFTLRELSDGTRRILGLSGEVFLGDLTSVAFIDELDRSLHSAVTRFLVDRMNKGGSHRQCVFTTHDTNLLDAGVFGRDAIWFCQKDRGGATHLYSLVEFDKAQLDQLTGKLEEGYLQGRFGALPFASDPVKLGWAKR
jgi:predicted ATPase